MIEVELPDGSIAEFPDGTSNDVIRGALQKRFGAPQQPDPQNADGTYGQAPEGMVLNPATGQMEDLRSPINPNIPTGTANAAMLGAGQGLGFNMLDEAAAGASTLFGGDYDYNLGRMREAERRAAEDNPVAYYGGTIGGAIGTGAGMASGGMSLGANAINAGWRLPGVAAASGAEGLALGGLYGFGSGEGLEDRLDKSETGAKWGGALGVATPLAVAGASKAAEKIISPFRASPERIAAAGTLQQEGIPLTAGQKTGSKWLQYRESELGGGRAADFMERQAEAFTDAAMRRAGGSGRATSDNMSSMASRIGQGFDDVSARNALRVDQGLVNDMNRAAQEYARVLPTEQRSIFQSLGNDIAERFKAGQGTMSGKDYQTIRSRLTRMSQNYRNSDSEFSSAIRGLRDALDSGMERSINPADAGVWSELRRQYGNMKTLENAVAGAGGESAAMGLISPARLRMSASSGNRGGYARGQGDFAELAKAGQALMTPLPNSGTAQRMAAQGIAAAILGGGGGAIGGPMGLAAGLAGPALAGRALMSRPVQSYLSNQAAGQMSPLARAWANAILTGNTSALSPRLGSP